jgi:hypothetical protein
MIGAAAEEEWRTRSKTFIADAYETDIILPSSFYSFRQGKTTDRVGPEELQDLALLIACCFSLFVGAFTYFVVVKAMAGTGILQSFVRDFFKHFDIYRVGHTAAAAADEMKWKKKEKRELMRIRSKMGEDSDSDSSEDDGDDEKEDEDKGIQAAAEELLKSVFEEDEGGDDARQFASFLGGIASICFFICFLALGSVQIYLFNEYNVEYSQSLFRRGPADSSSAFRSDFTVRLYFVGFTGVCPETGKENEGYDLAVAGIQVHGGELNTAVDYKCSGAEVNITWTAKSVEVLGQPKVYPSPSPDAVHRPPPLTHSLTGTLNSLAQSLTGTLTHWHTHTHTQLTDILTH